MNEYSHTIDAKGRMILPAKFREELGASFVLAPGLDTCLCIYPKEKWDALIARLQKLPFTNHKVRKSCATSSAGERKWSATSRGES